ncbi:hypothetical protein TI05_17290 [Achromatium sp. WMS3]|nr:hypothetical protein TI05_17290 [Achromatium sp. WMS3]
MTLEGIDGSGKTTHIPLIKTLLEQTGKTVQITREPGGTVLGEELRQIILKPRAASIENISELLLLAAARAEHVAKYIKPALNQGKWVVCDRFSDASRAYQGGGCKIDSKIIAIVEKIVLGDIYPNLTLLFDVPVEIALARTKSRNQLVDRFESEDIAFFERVRQAYLNIAALEPCRIKVIDTVQSLPKVQSAIAKVMHEFC